jgi:guanosine-3',5'-bis(diphosphate) 3'-pyrophosphohydrolase
MGDSMTTQNKYKLETCTYSDSLLSKIEEFNNDAIKQKKDQVDVDYIKKGISFAKYYHGSQARKSGEPYYSHPIIVAEMVANNIFSSNAIIGALLHDTLEDTTLTFSEIEYEFSPRIAQIVDRLTRKIDPLTGKKMSAGECLLKAQKLGDRDAVLIKMCDRLDNLLSVDIFSKEKANKILQESILMFCYWGVEFELFNLSKIGYSLCIKMKNKINNTDLSNNYHPNCFDSVLSNILSSNF